MFLRFTTLLVFNLITIGFTPYISASERTHWEETYAAALRIDEHNALSLLQSHYASLAPGYEKLYISSKIHSFMLVRGQPYYGNKLVYDESYTTLEQSFIEALNNEEQLNISEAKQALTALLQSASDIDGKILFEYHLCRLLNRQGKSKQAQFYCNNLNEHLTLVNDPIVPRHLALRVYANNQEYIGNYQQAIETYQTIIKDLPSYEDPSGIYNDAGLLLKTLGRIELAKEYLAHALTLRRAIGTPLPMAQSHHSLGDIMLSDGQYELAIYHFEQAKAIVETHNHPIGLTYVLLGLGKAYIANQQFSQGVEYLLDALENALIQDNAEVKVDIYMALARSYQARAELTTASSYANQAYKIAQSNHIERLEAQTLELLSNISEQKGDHVQALIYYKDFAKSELLRRDNHHNLAFLALESERTQFTENLEISRLEAQNIILDKKLGNADKLNKFYLFLFIVSLLCIAALVAIRRRENAHFKLDALTHSYNRTAAIRHIKKQQKVSDANQTHLLVLFDLDDFKNINDLYGHSTGDKALQVISESINTELSSLDMLGRFGGEEFIVLIPGIDEIEVVDRVERLHHIIANTCFTSETGKSLNVTASLSYLITPRALSNFDVLYSILDQALCQAKKNGKNTIIDADNNPISHSASVF
ncbi:diguanylate cyclase [Vibrio sp. NTOU-M3]|uniref:GGDEF domain-containing protein n=1 Tax=Vibrio sp. NTOU-M3 TaxID=3234954 RepID=UPI00349F958C